MTNWDAFKDSKVRHGTESGWRKHQELNENACTPCYLAKSAADRRRLGHPLRKLLSRARAKAQSKAESELVRRHHAEYRELYERFAREETDRARQLYEEAHGKTTGPS